MDLQQHKEGFHSALIQWYLAHQRPLPWRTEPSLYRTVVSELMAQQTQIKTMLPYFERWMQRFTGFEALANAAEEDVLKHWEGLGYYSRARNLHKLARAYVKADPKPRTRDEWKALPGIGPYTSAAIASICFDEPVAVVDGNVVRILARLTHDERIFASNADAVKAFTELAGKIINHEHPGDHNQAMMELGATVCLKRKPLCTLCPVREFCQSYARSDVESIPHIERKATERIELDRVWLCHHQQLLLHRIPDQAGQLAGQYELPELKHLSMDTPKETPLKINTRSITHRRIKEKIYAITPSDQTKKHVQNNPELYWVPIDELDGITLSGPHRRWVQELLNLQNSDHA
jgi:A/G-specific adenine glycosylase